MTRSPFEHPPGYRDGRLFFTDQDSAVLTTDFDVAAYTRNARGRFDVAQDHPVPEAEMLADLDYLWRIEAAALGDMRSMLASWTSREARVTAFLATWAYERYWNSFALRQYLRGAGGDPRRFGLRSLRGRIRHAYVQYVLPGVAPVAGIVVGEPVTAGHMARMAVHEGALQVAYRAVLPRLEGGARALVEEIIDRRETFLEFFRLEAAARIRRTRVERRSALLSLGWPWSPMRPDSIAEPDEGERLSSIFRDPATKAELAASDAQVAGLVGRSPSVTMVGAGMRRARTSAQSSRRRSNRGI